MELILRKTDDICLIADNPKELEKMLQICSNWAESNFMSFNPKKSEILVFSKYKFSDKLRNSFEHRFKIRGGNVEVKAEVKY